MAVTKSKTSNRRAILRVIETATVETRAGTSAEEKKTRRSEIIKQGVIYVQSVAAFNAGLNADHGDLKLAGCGGALGDAAFDSAEQAISRLNKISQTRNQPLSATEMKAKAAVCAAMMEFEDGSELNEESRLFVKHFAREAVAYFHDATMNIP
jgi:hypothetical protein